ncbi:winged helix-turn-helix domain-containing protein [Streptomyces montanisoli]|uniref:Winged helix-turn-helix domain-containing protein n=1 Tax=Streptomyces montanisoli TaxID=2798581 RepID=A0A940MBG4_9ACTN|nr:winged helix-turn-helix domain-containing protein [Streptomyces montanisoli]MBP0459869.1 winged helix-turn-helix domain-containing protein [Streptomyces montanisoli]
MAKPGTPSPRLGPRTPLSEGPLTGFTVGIVAARGHDGLAELLAARGARVLDAPVRRLVERTARREVHALTFTGAPALAAFLAAADACGRRTAVVEAMRADVVTVASGPGPGRRLLGLGAPAVWPGRAGLDALAHTVTGTLTARARHEMEIAGRHVVLQGARLLVSGESLRLTPRQAAVVRVLAEYPGRVVSRERLLRRAWPEADADGHAVEAAIGRLRSALGQHRDLIRTVPKRGYRLAAR